MDERTGYEPGRRARWALLQELRRLEDAGAAAPSWDELAAAAGLSKRQAGRHLDALRADGLVWWNPRQRRTTCLTREGRIRTNPRRSD